MDQDSDKTSTAMNIDLNPIISQATSENKVGTAQYNNQDLQNMPNGKKSISDFLKRNNNVQFQRNAFSAGTQASLSPEDFSINGAPSFSNKFVVNGVNTTNTFDPVGTTANTNFTTLSSQSQTANINTDLLCELEVLDSNVSARHGDFQGGVIKANTCAPSTPVGELHGAIGLDYTTDAWSRFNYVDAAEEIAFEDAQDTSHHREYTTWGYSSSLYGNLTDQLGFNLNLAQRKSIIPVMTGFSDQKINTKQYNDSLGLTVFYRPHEQHQLKFGYDLFYGSEDGYTKNMLNSDFSKNNITHAAFINSIQNLAYAKLEQNLSYRHSDNEREMKKNYSVIWDYAEGSKDWRDASSITEGGVGGNLINRQQKLSYDINALFQPLQFMQTSHQFALGGEYTHNEGRWIRPDATYTYTTRSNLQGQTCAAGDPLCDPAPTRKGWEGQYTTYGVYYGAGDYLSRQDQWALYAEDNIKWRNFSARIGLRIDYETLAGNLNLAPRLNLHYQPFTSDLLRLTTGYNRYYGSTYLVTELDELAYSNNGKVTRINPYQPDWSADNDYGWQLNLNKPTGGTKATDLNTPYSDEKLFAIQSKISQLNLELKWVQRSFHDQVRQQSATDDTPRTFVNVNGGEADTYSLNMSHANPLELWGTRHNISFGLSYVKQNTLRGDYRKTDDAAAGYHQQIMVDGKLIYKSDLPTKDQPLTARLSWNIDALNERLKFNNFFYFRSGSENYTVTDKNFITDHNELINVYEKKSYASKFNWDSRLSYDWYQKEHSKLSTGLTISNVLNKKNVAVTDNGTRYSEEGRRFVADISYKF